VRLTAAQEAANALLGGAARHVLLDGGSRSGKTFLLVRAMCLTALAVPGSRQAILRFRFNAVKEAVAMDTYPAVMRDCFPGVAAPINKSDWYAQFANGAEIWFGGLDDKERTEKILGKEYCRILLNECSQIPWATRNIVVTRLAQRCHYEIDGRRLELPLRMYYDCNPPGKGHWTYRLFHLHVDPETRVRLPDPGNYATMRLNPRDNAENLPPEYLSELERLPARLQRRFLRGEYADEAQGQLWTEDMLDRWRTLDAQLPDMQRIIVAVDPSGASDDDTDHDEVGIMVGGLGSDGNGYLLEDLTINAGPARWGSVVTQAFERHAADLVVGEANYGGDMVRHVIQTARARTPYKSVRASRGKVVRAEPIAGLHETGKIRLVGNFAKLEDELLAMTTHGYVGERSPNRADAFVWLFTELFPGLTRAEPQQREQRRVAYPHGAGGWMV